MNVNYRSSSEHGNVVAYLILSATSRHLEIGGPSSAKSCRTGSSSALVDAELPSVRDLLLSFISDCIVDIACCEALCTSKLSKYHSREMVGSPTQQ